MAVESDINYLKIRGRIYDGSDQSDARVRYSVFFCGMG